METKTKRFVTVLVVTVAVSAVVPSPAVGLASAEASENNRLDRGRGSGIEVSECTTIDTSGKYVLTENISKDTPSEEETTCIEITADDVVFDGGGNEIEGNVSARGYPFYDLIGGTAIRATNVTNITVQNIRLRSWKNGVRFRNVSDGDIQIRAFDHAAPDVTDSEDIVFHDSVLRSTGSTFEADSVVVRRNDIEMDPEFYAVRHGIRITGDDGEVSNNTIDTARTSSRAYPVGLVIDGDGHGVEDNVIVGERPTRRDPNPSEGVGFFIRGNGSTIRNNTVDWTNRDSDLRGDDNVFANNLVNSSDLDVEGNNNRIFDSKFNRSLGVDGSDSVVFDSRARRISIGANSTAFQNTVETLSVSGFNGSIVNNDVSSSIIVRREDNVTVVDNDVGNESDDDYRPSNIYVENSDNITLINNSVADDIQVTKTNNGRLRDNTVGGTLQLEQIRNSTIQNDTGTVVDLTDAHRNSLRGLTAETITLSSISDNNTITGSSADRIRVVDDSRNNTLRDNDASIRIAGETSFDNRVLGNNASGSDVGIELDRARRTVVANSTVTNNSRGVVLVGATDNQLVNNTAVNNDGPAYVSRTGSVNNTVTNLTIGPTVTFRSRDVALDTEPSPPEPPAGKADVGVFLDATNTSADSWLNLTARYSADAAADVEEETLRLWRYDGSWAEVPGFNRVSTADNTVSGNVSGESFGVLAPLGNATDDTAPTVTDYDARASDEETLAVEFTSGERLSKVLVVITNANGDEVDRLNESDFAESGVGPYTYTASVDLPNGTYTATLETVTDRFGNDGASGQSDTETVGIAAVQLSLTANRTTIETGDVVNFTVTRGDTGDRANATVLTDDRAIPTGADGQVNVPFTAAGTFEVTATKADTATETFRNDSIDITVRSPSGRQSRIAVDPSTETVAVGESFRVAVTYNATSADEVYAAQFALEYDTSVLNATDVTKGPYLGPEADTLTLNESINDDIGLVRYGESRRSDDGVSGNGTLAYVEFTAVESIETTGKRANISLSEVKISDPEARPIETSRRNGSVRIERNPPPELSASVPFSVNNVGSPVRVGVHATDDAQVREIRLLGSNGSELDTLSCGTAECNGTVSTIPTTSSWNDSTGQYDPVPYGVVATDDRGGNATEAIRTEIYIAGDANGDGVVDIVDAVGVGRSWTCTADESCYSDASDLNNDGVVDIFDAVAIGRNWQERAGS